MQKQASAVSVGLKIYLRTVAKLAAELTSILLTYEAEAFER